LQKESDVTNKQRAGPGASLNVKQKLFVEDSLIDLSATQAVMRALATALNQRKLQVFGR